MFQSWKIRMAMPAVLAVVMVGGAAFGADAEKKEGKDLSGPRAHPPATQPGERGFGRRDGRGQEMMQLLGDLNLSDDQKAQVRDIQEDFHKKLEAFHKEHGDEMKKLRDEMDAARDAKDKEKAMAPGEKMKKLMEGSGINFKDHLDKIRNVLNDEQKKKFDEKVKERMEKGPGGPGMGGPMNRGERRRERGDKDGATTRPSEEKKHLNI